MTMFSNYENQVVLYGSDKCHIAAICYYFLTVRQIVARFYSAWNEHNVVGGAGKSMILCITGQNQFLLMHLLNLSTRMLKRSIMP